MSKIFIADESVTTKLPCTAELYKWYLSGMSLRAIARKVGLGKRHKVIYGALQRAYGKDCCSPAKVSLLRSVLKDHRVSLEDLGDLEPYLETSERFRSQETLNNLSQYKTVFDPERIERVRANKTPWDYIEPDSALDFLRLPLYTMLVHCICYELQRLTSSYISEETGPS